MVDSNASPADVIRRRRVALGLSRAELGEKVGRTGSTVRRWERSEGLPPEALIPALAAALEVHASQLKADRAPRAAKEPGTRAESGETRPETPPTATPPTRPAAPPRELSPPPPAPDPTRSEVTHSPQDRPPTRPPPPPPPTPPDDDPDEQRRSDVSDLPTEVMALPSEQETRAVAPPRSEPLRPVPPVAAAVPAPSYVEDPRQRYRYWLRYLLTGIAIAIMLIILAWAFTELREALSEVWDLFQEEEIENGDLGTDF